MLARHPLLSAAEAACGVALECSGDTGLLDHPRRMLLISRGERHPQPDTPWLADTIAAARSCAAAGEAIVTGSERIAYDAALFTIAQHGGAAIVVLEAPLIPDDELRAILPKRHLLLWPAAKTKDAALRDNLIAQLCERATAIRVRNGGNMARIAEMLAQRGVPVCHGSGAFSRPVPEARPTQHGSEVTGKNAHNRSEGMATQHGSGYGPRPVAHDWDYLTHFTREPDGAWPGETHRDYLAWLCSGASGARRDAFAALRRILEQRRIAACGRLIPGGAPMVCFTALHPLQAQALRCWRRGLLRWNFTPYGIAIRRGALVALGARPVQYAAETQLRAASPAAQPFMQRDRAGAYDWTTEVEWRVAGDVDLRNVARENLLICAPIAEEAMRLEGEFEVKAMGHTN